MLDIIKRANIAVIFGWWSISDLGFRVRRENGPFPANTRRSITPARAHIGSRILPLSDRSWIIRTIHQEAHTHTHTHTFTHRFWVNYLSRSYVLTRYFTNARLVLFVISRYLVFNGITGFTIKCKQRWIIVSNLLRWIEKKKKKRSLLPARLHNWFFSGLHQPLPAAMLTTRTFNANYGNSIRTQVWKSCEIFSLIRKIFFFTYLFLHTCRE